MILGIGTDLIEIHRIKAAVTRRPRLQQKLFTEKERQYCFAKPDPWPSLAARFAAKEAVMKAMGVGSGVCPFRQIEILKEPEGSPSIRLHGKALTLAQKKGITQWLLSLSHNRTDAIAFVLAEKGLGESG